MGDWVLWGVYPFLAANAGFWLSAITLEFVLSRVLRSTAIYKTNPPLFSWAYWFRPLEYSGVTRQDGIVNSQVKIPFLEQLKLAALQIMGPMAVCGAALAAAVLPYLVPQPESSCPSIASFAWQLVIMELVGDFGLYWGHRVQHENEYLWKTFHSVHHRVLTPTPITTLYLDGVDATLQASLPMLLAAAGDGTCPDRQRREHTHTHARARAHAHTHTHTHN